MNKGGFVFAQRPNLPLIVAAAAWLAARVLSGEVLGEWFSQTVFFTAILYWAYLEFTDGTSWFRRALGAIVGLVNIWSIIERLI